MTKANKIMVGAGVLVALAVLVTATVANKDWWKRRIDARWKYQNMFSEELNAWGSRGWRPMSNYTYGQLIKWYVQGDEAWFKTEEEQTAWVKQTNPYEVSEAAQ